MKFPRRKKGIEAVPTPWIVVLTCANLVIMVLCSIAVPTTGWWGLAFVPAALYSARSFGQDVIELMSRRNGARE